MDARLFIPSPDTIPIHWGWFQGLLLVTFVLHILLMNTMLGTGIIAMVSVFKKGPENLATAKKISTGLPTIIAFTINSGVAPLLFIHVLYGQFIFTSSVLMGVYWLSIVGILLMAYYAAYLFDFKFDTAGSAGSWMIAISTLGLLIIGFLFSSNMTLMLFPENWIAYFSNSNGTILSFSEPMLIPRYLHFVCASVAIGGLAIAWMWRIASRRNGMDVDEKIGGAMKWFTNATLVQFPLGILFFLALPMSVRTRFIGSDPFATGLFMAALTGAVLSLLFGFKKDVGKCTAAVVFTIVLMALMRDLVRRMCLAPYFRFTDLEITSQYGSFALFLVSLTAAIAIVIYMLKLAFKDKKEVLP